MYFNPLAAESNDLDDILADLMKFEEDTKAQLASGGSGQPSIDVELPSPTKVMKGTVNKNAISSEEFMKFMMNLPDSRDLVVDPSKTLSSSKLAKMVSQEQSGEGEREGWMDGWTDGRADGWMDGYMIYD
jgi:hypothetical protein